MDEKRRFSFANFLHFFFQVTSFSKSELIGNLHKCNKIFLGSSEEENQVKSFESGLDREAREADPARRQRKDQAKRKNQTERKNQAQRKNQAKRKNKAEKKNQEKRKNQAQRKKQAKRSKAEKENQAKRKNKKGKSNKRKGLKAKKGGKGQKGKRNNRKKGNKNGKKGKKNRKAERNEKKEGKKGNKTGNGKKQNRKNTGEARQCRVTTTCSDTAVAAHKLMKDKVDNFVKQHKRITKKTTIGSKKSSKNDVFKPVLQRLAAAAGGNISGKQPKISKEVIFIFDFFPSSCLCWKLK